MSETSRAPVQALWICRVCSPDAGWRQPVPHALAETVSTFPGAAPDFGPVEVPAHPASRPTAMRMAAYLTAREATVQRQATDMLVVVASSRLLPVFDA